MSNGRLRLENEDFWGDYQRTRDQVVEEIGRDDFLGLLLDAPARVSLNRRTTVPVVGMFARTLRDDLRIEQERQLLVAAVRRDTGELGIGLALDTGKIPAPAGPPDLEDPGPGTTVNMFTFDLRRVLGLPWQASRYLVAVLLREHVSDAVAVDLGRDAADYDDPAVAPFLAEQKEMAVTPPPPPVCPLPHPQPQSGQPPHFQPLADLPAPELPGVVLSAQRVVVAKEGGRCILQGSFRLPVARRFRVEPRSEGAARPEVGDAQATAVLPVHLVITGSDNPGPWVISLAVPVYQPLPPHPAVADGYFTLDLFQLPGFPRTPMTYFVSAWTAEAISRPVPIAIVSESMIEA